MNLEACIKYLNYLANECSRHLQDGNVSDDELIGFIIELQRFQEMCMKSQLPEPIKLKVADLHTGYTVERVTRGAWFSLLVFGTLGIWYYVLRFKQESKRKQTLYAIQYDTSRLATFIRLNYESQN